jgi:hypothetical protein
VSNPTGDFDRIGLYLHSASPTVATLTPLKVDINLFSANRQASRQALQNRRYGRPMGFPGRKIS